jgi:hypothetical protein
VPSVSIRAWGRTEMKTKTKKKAMLSTGSGKLRTAFRIHSLLPV